MPTTLPPEWTPERPWFVDARVGCAAIVHGPHQDSPGLGSDYHGVVYYVHARPVPACALLWMQVQADRLNDGRVAFRTLEAEGFVERGATMPRVEERIGRLALTPKEP